MLPARPHLSPLFGDSEWDIRSIPYRSEALSILLFPSKLATIVFLEAKSRDYQFDQIDIVFVPNPLDQDLCKLTKSVSIHLSCSPTKEAPPHGQKGVGVTDEM